MANYSPSQANWSAIPRPGTPVDFNQSTAATHSIASAVAGRAFRLLSAELYIAGAQVLSFKSASDDITGGTFEFGGSGWLTLGVKYGHNIRTRKGEALQLALSQAVKVRGPIVYETITTDD